MVLSPLLKSVVLTHRILVFFLLLDILIFSLIFALHWVWADLRHKSFSIMKASGFSCPGSTFHLDESLIEWDVGIYFYCRISWNLTCLKYCLCVEDEDAWRKNCIEGRSTWLNPSCQFTCPRIIVATKLISMLRPQSVKSSFWLTSTCPVNYFANSANIFWLESVKIHTVTTYCPKVMWKNKENTNKTASSLQMCVTAAARRKKANWAVVETI